MNKILKGEKCSPILSTLCDFEQLDVEKWLQIKQNHQIPDGFLFLAGVAKYPKKCPQAHLRFGKELIFVQNFRPYTNTAGGEYRTRGYRKIFSLYEPENIFHDDVVLEVSGIYQAFSDGSIKMVLADGEHRKRSCVYEMFKKLCDERGFEDFSTQTGPLLHEVTFNNRSCGYFLKGCSYTVWAMPIGIPDHVSGELIKAWLICDINCGVPAILRAEQEELLRLSIKEDSKVGLFSYHNDTLRFV